MTGQSLHMRARICGWPWLPSMPLLFFDFCCSMHTKVQELPLQLAHRPGLQRWRITVLQAGLNACSMGCHHAC